MESNGEDNESPSPQKYLAFGEAAVVFDLQPKYTAKMLNFKKPTSIQISASISSPSGPAQNINEIILFLKDPTGIVGSLALHDWTVSMGNNYVYNLSPLEIDNIWDILSKLNDSSIYEVRFINFRGADLQHLSMTLTITQAVSKN